MLHTRRSVLIILLQNAACHLSMWTFFGCVRELPAYSTNPGLSMQSHHEVMGTWSVLSSFTVPRLRPARLSVCLYSLSLCCRSQAFPGRCTPGSSPFALASFSTAGRWSRACSKISAASRRTSTRRSSWRTACRSCSRSCAPARSPRFSFKCL